MIRCKRVYEEAARDDGYRVLVDRLWPRGVAKSALVYDEWCKALAPSTELRKAFHSETIDYAAFCEAYRQELTQQPDEIARLKAIARDKTLTLLYAAKGEQHHARVLADVLGE